MCKMYELIIAMVTELQRLALSYRSRVTDTATATKPSCYRTRTTTAGADCDDMDKYICAVVDRVCVYYTN